MPPPKLIPPKGLQLGGLIFLVVGVVLGVGFREPAGMGIALLGVALLWGSWLLAWWEKRS